MKPEHRTGWDKKRKVAVVLAGGLSRRFGEDKVFATVQKKSFIEIIIDKLLRTQFEIVISVAKPKVLPEAVRRFPLLEDPMPGEGPLQALHGAFLQLRCSKLLLVACDMPFIVSDLFEKLWEESACAAVCALKFQEKILPLPAVYSRDVIPCAWDFLNKGRRDLKSLLESGLSLQILSEKNWRSLDPEGQSVVNINTPENLQGMGVMGLLKNVIPAPASAGINSSRNPEVVEINDKLPGDAQSDKRAPFFQRH